MNMCDKCLDNIDWEQFSFEVDYSSNSHTSIPCELCKLCEHIAKIKSGSRTGVSTHEHSSVDGSVISTSELGNSSLGRKTVADAAHPFFTSYRNMCWFHCNQCNERFELCLVAVKRHFASKQHSPVDSCIYCGTDVYEYFYKEKTLYYHRCVQDVPNRSVTEQERSSTSTSDISLSTSETSREEVDI